MGIVEQFLLQFNNEKRRFKRAAAILSALSVFVVIGVAWNLRITAITIANDATCSKEEHQHTELCVVEKVLSCDLTEDIMAVAPITEEVVGDTRAENTEEETIEDKTEETVEQIAEQTRVTPPVHTHTDECYSDIYSCGLEEHIHSISCYSDTTMDIETSAIWEPTLPQLTGHWAEDIVLIAQSQIGNKESERNYIVADDGQTKNGITRYGQWYGNPYGDWSTMFVMFCLNYAQVPEQTVPHSPGAYNMMRLAEEAQIFMQPDENMSKPGNLLFVDTDDNGNADSVLVFTQCINGEFLAIGGDIENAVTEVTLMTEGGGIVGYIDIQRLQSLYSENTDSDITGEIVTDDEEQSTDPAIILDIEFLEDERFRLFAEVKNVETDMYLWQWQYSADGNEPWTDIEGAMDFVLELEATEENFIRHYRLQGRKMQMMLMTLELVEEEPQPETEREIESEDDIITSGSISPFSINKNNNNYSIDIYALPVDANGNRITGMEVKKLNTLTVNSTTRTEVKNRFDTSLGEYKSAYFGTENSISVDNIFSVWRYETGWWSKTYYLAYQLTSGTQNTQWLSNSNTSISLYLRYVPNFTVTFQSEGYDSITEKVSYNETIKLARQPQWEKEDYTLIGWSSGENVYTFEEIQRLPVTKDVTYTAKWAENPTVTFDVGDEYKDLIYPIEAIEVAYGGTIEQLPTPEWKFNTVAMAFGGWYINEEFTIEATADYKYMDDTILYAKWQPKEDGYFVYFMDFERGHPQPLVLTTFGVTEGKTVSPYVPSNAPEDKEWDGKWYLNPERNIEYNFRIPVSQMTDYLTGALGRDLYLYPGTKDICKAIFVTYGTRIDPVTVSQGSAINLNDYIPQRTGFKFAGWTLADGTAVSGNYQLDETTTFVARWTADYVPFEAILRIENANNTKMTQANILGTWYAKAGSQIKVKSTYTGTGNNRKGTHTVVCVLDGVEYPVYTNSNLTTQATLSDVYNTYFLYNNTGTSWTDEVNWDDIYTGGELPYSTRPISSAGDTIINFDYMRVRNDIKFTINNTNTGGYIDVFKLKQNGLITGSVVYSGTAPTTTGRNVSASGVAENGIRWSYSASTTSNGNNYYTLHDMKYGQRIFEVYPVGGSWLTPRGNAFHQYRVTNSLLFSSRRQDLTSDFFTGSGRAVTPQPLVAEFKINDDIALMYAIECLEGEQADFTVGGVDYKVSVELCEVVKHTGYFGIKALEGCKAGVNMLGQDSSGNNRYYSWYDYSGSNDYRVTTKVGDTNVTAEKLFHETYWQHYSKFNGVVDLSTFEKMYIFRYDRLKMNIQFNFAYDADGNGSTEAVRYDNIAYGEKINEYQFGKDDFQQHPLLEREGYQFAGWLDANGFVLEAEDWDSMVATGDSNNNTMIFIAKWEKISNNIVEYYEDRSAAQPFEEHFFEDGELVQYPTMTVYPDGWVWQEYGEGQYERFDWDVPMYGEYGVQETRVINGEERVVNVIRIYGTWDESHTRVVYLPNEPAGGIPDTAPSDYNEYTIWQSAVSVAAKGNTANVDPEMIFVGWKLDRNGVVYQPGDHVPVQWPRTMVFTAQWAKASEVVYLLYDPNGGTPVDRYPNDTGFAYRKNATAYVWHNQQQDGAPWFTRAGYKFTGWNTLPDGTGTAYAPESTIVLTQPRTVLYAQWEKEKYNLSVYKTDSDNGAYLKGAQFGLYKLVDGRYLTVDSFTTGKEGVINFLNLEVDTIYKLIEENPPDGYAIITKEFTFGLKPDPNTNIISFVFYDALGNPTSAPEGVSGEYTTYSKYLTITVKNLRGYELPATGGTGSMIYILCGTILVMAPLVYRLGLRRKYERRLRE